MSSEHRIDSLAFIVHQIFFQTLRKNLRMRFFSRRDAHLGGSDGLFKLGRVVGVKGRRVSVVHVSVNHTPRIYLRESRSGTSLPTSTNSTSA